MSITFMSQAIWNNKYRFFGAFFLVFTLIYALLFVLDFLPEAPTSTSDEVDSTLVTTVASTVEVAPTVTETPIMVTSVPDLPTSVYIERLDKTIKVLNPESRSIADLDQALLSGVVRHPDSVTPNVDGNVFILGHSSYLPNVLNKNFQAFNGIQDLEWGDIITLTSDGMIYTYKVERVYKAKASEVTVPVAGDEKLLTIATCNSFGSTDDRHIVEAKQISAIAATT